MIKNILLTLIACLIGVFYVQNAYAQSCPTCCYPYVSSCQNFCVCVSDAETGNSGDPNTTIGHITFEFERHRIWMVEGFSRDREEGDNMGLFAAMQLMTGQLTTNIIQQAQIIGSFFDAKHQLESQRLFQTLTARAHKDYHPSQNLCSFGTMTQSLAKASRKSDMMAITLSRQSIDRQLSVGDGIAVNNNESDRNSRLVDFIRDYCDPRDNAENLDYLCANSLNNAALYNRDISFNDVIKRPMTLALDVNEAPEVSTDEAAYFALTNNLFGHDIYPPIQQSMLVDPEGDIAYDTGVKVHMDARALVAKRSVAVNSFAAIAAMKAQSDDTSQPFIYALIREMGGDEATLDAIRSLIGENPSYYAQMKVLSKLYYQRPEFIVDLLDKPANIMRMNAAIQAATLMRKRDLYRSYLRSEMTLAVMLETALLPEITLIQNEYNRKGGQ
ncbi:MAG: hypothetical protein AAGB32_03830 [Pseudomonadota bacterium]